VTYILTVSNMSAYLEIVLGTILSTICVSLNVVCEVFRLLFRRNAEINPAEQVVVITGCDSGFGMMAAVQLSKFRFRVIAGCLTEKGCENISAKVALAVKCDVTKEEDITRLAKEAASYCASNACKVWAVVNNAGIGPGGCMDWYSMEMYRKLLEVNLFGLIGVTKAFLPLLKRNPGARYINLSSLAGIVGGSKMTAYCASKHAVEGFAKSLRVELGPWGLHVCNINPGFMK
jgi:dehydrogenase/reductase SDR family member 9